MSCRSCLAWCVPSKTTVCVSDQLCRVTAVRLGVCRLRLLCVFQINYVVSQLFGLVCRNSPLRLLCVFQINYVVSQLFGLVCRNSPLRLLCVFQINYVVSQLFGLVCAL